MKRAIIVLCSVPILLVTAWWTLALVFAGPGPAWLGTALAAIYALGTLAILLWLRPFAWALAACGLGFVALMIWWSTIRPSNEGDWQADVARLPRVEIRGEQLVVHNCTTSIRRHREHVDPDAPPIDWRLFANGYLDRRMYDRSIVDTSLPFEELRRLSQIDDRAKAAGRDPAFSQRIREGLPSPRP